MPDLTEHSKLKEELDSWLYFKAALRVEDRTVVKEMNESIFDCAAMVENAPEGFETETYFLALLIHHQKLIDSLEERMNQDSSSVNRTATLNGSKTTQDEIMQ